MRLSASAVEAAWSLPARGAYARLRNDRRRATAAIVGIAVSYFLMVFQGGLLAGFISAASKLVTASNADIWVTAKNVPCVECGSSIEDALVDRLTAIEGVTESARVVTGFTSWLGPGAERRTVAVVGLDPTSVSNLPFGSFSTHASSLPESVAIDRSDEPTLGVVGIPIEVEISGRRANVTEAVDGYSTFMGSPLVFTEYEYARDLLAIDDLSTNFIILSIDSSSNARHIVNLIERAHPELEAWPASQFAWQTSVYWMTETGAGGGLALTGLLGLLVGALITSQVMYAMTMDSVGEFATMIAIGAAPSFATRMVTVQALMCALAGSSLGAAALWPVIHLVRAYVVPWIAVPLWLPLLCLFVVLVVAVVACWSSIRMVRRIEPAHVFRT